MKKWYGRQNELDYTKPIIADTGISKYLLLPQIKKDACVGELNAGFNWFSLDGGFYNSSCFFETAKEAVESYRSYKIYNAEINIKKI